MTKTINKKAYIRSNEVKGCPFGLPIPDGCKLAGNGIERLCPLESSEADTDEKKKEAANLNRKVFFYSQEGKPCKYAQDVIKNRNTVNCDWGDTAEGMKTVPLEGSPFYPKIQSGDFTGLYSAPISFFVSLDVLYRNYPYGLFSYYGSLNEFVDGRKEKIIKIADALDAEGDEDRADFIDDILQKIIEGEKVPLIDAKEFVEVCRERFDKNRITATEEQDLKNAPRSST